MAHHGYTVANGWFQGACPGHQFAPIERSHDVADQIIADVQKQLGDLRAQAAQIRLGEYFPEFVETYRDRRGREKIRIPYADATPYQQEEYLNQLVFDIENRIRAGEDFIQMMESVISLYHGKPLMEVTKKEPPAPIPIGETRISQRGNLRVKRVDGGRVEWVDEKGFRGHSSTRSWRQMPLTSDGLASENGKDKPIVHDRDDSVPKVVQKEDDGLSLPNEAARIAEDDRDASLSQEALHATE